MFPSDFDYEGDGAWLDSYEGTHFHELVSAKTTSEEDRGVIKVRFTTQWALLSSTNDSLQKKIDASSEPIVLAHSYKRNIEPNYHHYFYTEVASTLASVMDAPPQPSEMKGYDWNKPLQDAEAGKFRGARAYSHVTPGTKPSKKNGKFYPKTRFERA